MTLDLKNELHNRAFIAAAGEYLTEWEAIKVQDLHDELEEGNLDGITVCETYEYYPAEWILEHIIKLANSFVAFQTEGSKRETYGEMIGAKAMILRENVGTAEGDEDSFEMTTTMSRSPLVKSSKTGKTFSLSWASIINMAVEAGVSNPD